MAGGTEVKMEWEDKDNVVKKKKQIEKSFKNKTVPNMWTKAWAKWVKRIARRMCPEETGQLKSSIGIMKLRDGSWSVGTIKPSEPAKANKAYMEGKEYAAAVEFGASEVRTPIWSWQKEEFWPHGRGAISPNPFFRPALQLVSRKCFSKGEPNEKVKAWLRHWVT